MGIIDTIIGRGGDKGGSNPGDDLMQSQYGQMTQPMDPSIVPLMNAPQQGNAQIAQFATENEATVKKFREGLRGRRVVKKYNVQTHREENAEEIYSTPSMNDTGISEMCRELEMYLSKTFILSNIPTMDKRRVDAMGRIIWKTLNQKLIVNAQKYELDKTRRPTIVHEMVFIILANTMRAFEDGERGKFYGSQRTLQTISSQGGIAQATAAKRNIFGF